MPGERKYIYGIIEEPEPKRFSLSGVMNTEVFTIHHRRLAAAVSDVRFGEIDPTRANVTAHTLVQDKLLADYTLLPMAFGMIAGSKEDVSSLISRNYEGLTGQMEQLAGRVEIELKVFWDMAAMDNELQGGHGNLALLREKLDTAPSPAEARRLLMEAGQMVERIALEWKTKYADRVYASLQKLAVDARVNNPLGVKNILNASFLVEKTAENDFKQEVCRLDAEYQSKVNFKYVGPMAPYNFISLQLEMAD